MLDTGGLWTMYESAAENNGLATDVITNGVIHLVSDSIAQATERSGLVNRRQERPTTDGPDFARVARFGAFGAADGAVSHGWFYALDAVVGESGTLSETLLKVAADQLIYTPLFCIWFLAAFVILEKRDARTIPKVLQTEWLELFRGNVGFFLPLTGIIYGLVPREERVLAFGAGSLVYTWILSLWNSARDEKRSAEEAEAELCFLGADKGVLGEDDCTPVQAPARSRALLSVGMRRSLVRVKRRTRLPTMQQQQQQPDEAGGDRTAPKGGPPPQRLEMWAQLDDGRYVGEVVGAGQTLWIHPADVVSSSCGLPSQIRSRNGQIFELGTPRRSEFHVEPSTSPSSADVVRESLYAMVARRQSQAQRALSFVSSVWPTLVVCATLVLSSSFGVVPGTCIGPMQM